MGRPSGRTVAVLAAVLLVAALLAGAALRDGSSAAPDPPPGGAQDRGIYWGAAIGDHLTGTQAPWDMGAVESFEAATGKGLSLVDVAVPFANCESEEECSYYPFPAEQLEAIREYGAIPFFSWASQSIPSSLDQPEFQLSDVITGDHDEHIHGFAEAAAQWGHPFFLRFNWEMNGGWFPWSEGVNGNQPGEYVDAWRHVHDIFADAGATNVTWVWCPDADPSREHREMAPLYPGDAYVDWTCLDGYNWGTNPARPDRWRSFDDVFRESYDLVTESIAPSKPMVLGEFASTEVGGSRIEWIEAALEKIPREYPRIRGLVWFEKVDDDMDWPIGHSEPSSAAFAEGIDSPTYRPNEFGDIDTSPISPPG